MREFAILLVFTEKILEQLQKFFDENIFFHPTFALKVIRRTKIILNFL